MNNLSTKIRELTNTIEMLAAQMQHYLNQEGKTSKGKAKIKDLKVLYDLCVKQRAELESILQN